MARVKKHIGANGDQMVGWLLFVALSTIYVATLSGITSSNDGSHYALLRTLVANRTFALRQFDDYAEGNDIAIVDDTLYSDRPPGNAVTAVPFYLLGQLLPDPPVPLPSRHDVGNPALLLMLLLPVLTGVGTVLLLYTLLRRLGVSLAAAFLTAVFFALGTIHWKYSTVFFSHALSSLLVLASVMLSLRLVNNPYANWPRYALLGFLLGWAVVVEYANGLLVVLAAGFVLWSLPDYYGRTLRYTILPLIAAGLVPALFLAFYNSTNFGGPFTLSYAFASNYPWAGQFSTTFNFPLQDGLRALLWFGSGDGWCGGDCLNQGVFLLSPIMLLALPGLWFYYRADRRAFLFTTAVFLIYLLLFARHRTFHGFTADGRYLAPFLSLLALPASFALDALWRQMRRETLPWLPVIVLVFGLFFLSLRNMALHIATSFNYTLDLTQLHPLVAHPDNWRLLAAALFPNAGNLLYFWTLTAVGTLFLWLYRKSSWRPFIFG